MSESLPPPVPDQDGLPAPQRYLAVLVLLLTLVLVVLDGAIANVALPTIATTFDAHASDTVWVVSSYQLAVLVALLPFGAFGEIWGARRVFLGGVALFTVGSALCAFAPSLLLLIGARFLQGLGGGAIMALATMNLRFAVPQRMLGTIIGFNAMTIAISSAAGPGIAGAILSVASWPWLFAVNLPIGLLVLALGGKLPLVNTVKRRLNGVALLANALFFILFFTGADQLPTTPLLGLAMILAAGASLAGLLYIERDSPAPLVPTDLLAAPAFRVAVIASVMCFTGQMLGTVALPFYLQHGLGMTPVQAGLFMMPWPAAVIVVAPIAGRLSDRFKTAWLCSIGGAALAVGLLMIALLPAGPLHASFIAGSLLAGAGFGLFQTPNNRILLLSAPKARSGAAGAMQGTARLLGQTMGALAMSLIFGAVPFAAATTVALVIAATFAAASSVVSFSRGRFEAGRPALPTPEVAS